MKGQGRRRPENVDVGGAGEFVRPDVGELDSTREATEAACQNRRAVLKDL